MKKQQQPSAFDGVLRAIPYVVEGGKAAYSYLSKQQRAPQAPQVQQQRPATQIVVRGQQPRRRGRKPKGSPSISFTGRPQARSIRYANAPLAKAIGWDGPVVQILAFERKGSAGMRLRIRFLYCSIEQNTTTTLRGALRDMSVAGVAGDTSMIVSQLSPLIAYAATTSAGACAMYSAYILNIGALFARYQVNQMAIQYKAESPTSTTGGLAVGYHPTALFSSTSDYDSLIDVTDCPDSILTSLWDDAYLPVCRTLMNEPLYTQYSNSSLQDPQTVRWGSLIGRFDQAGTANAVFGKLFMELDISFWDANRSPTTIGVGGRERIPLTLKSVVAEEVKKEKEEEKRKESDLVIL